MCEIDNEEELFESVCRAFENKNECDIKRKNAHAVLHSFDSNESKKKFYEVIANC